MTCAGAAAALVLGVAAWVAVALAAAGPTAEERRVESLRADLSELSDRIGPRLTGTPAVSAAAAWAAGRFHAHGVERVWTETWQFEHPWRRGPIEVRLTKPHAAPVAAVAWGWTPGTDGPRRGPVVALDARTEAEFRSGFGGRLRGAWVMTFPPAIVADRDLPLRAPAAPAREATAAERDYQARLRALLVTEGVAGLLKDAAKPDGLHTVTVTGLPARPYPMPALVLSNERYAQLWRLSRRGVEVELEANVDNGFPAGPVQQPNVLAEIRGTARPDEVVLVAAHLDSWDLATGANDDGAGVAAVLEAARLLAGSGRRPRRTIRFALFTGEEQGRLGAAAYIRGHRKELRDLQAVLVLDGGSGRITGVSLEGREDLGPAWRGAFSTVADLGPFTTVAQGDGDSDQQAFTPCGIPAFQFEQQDSGYAKLHHSEIDTLEHVDWGGLAQASAVLAAVSRFFADTPDRLAHGGGSC